MTAEELIGRVRNTVNDYGDIEDIVSTTIYTITTDSDTEWDVDDASNFDQGDWGYIDWEAVEVIDTDTVPTPNTITVNRAQRGTTGAVHAVGAILRANLRFGKLQVLNTLNASLAGAFPLLFKITEDTSVTTVSGQELYSLSAGHRKVRSLWIEQTIGEEDYTLVRSYQLVNDQDFMLYGGFDAGYKIKAICIDNFDRMTQGGTLDTDFPDDDEAYDYLVKDASGRLLHALAAQEAISNSSPARGASDQDSRYVLLNAAKDLRNEAKESLRRARMYVPARIMPRPDARYF